MLVGLGNPGLEYESTRHNVGFMVVDAVSEFYGFPKFSSRFDALTSSGVVASQKVMLLKPSTFMNDSGRAVLKATTFYKVALGDVIVVHDDVDLPFGTLKVKKGGGSAGHNGLKSIDKTVGRDYWRLRVGIGRPALQYDLSSFVLAPFDNLEEVRELCVYIAQNISTLLSGDEFKKAPLKSYTPSKAN